MARTLSTLVPSLLSMLIFLSFIKPSFQNTHYTDQNTTIVVQSVEPCHIYRDPDLYGVGIRISFCVTWATLFFATLLPNNGKFNNDDEFKNARRAFNIVALSVLINTYISITNGSFAALEIFIVCTLVISLSLLFLLPDIEIETINFFDSPAFYNDPIGFGFLSLLIGVFLCTQPTGGGLCCLNRRGLVSSLSSWELPLSSTVATVPTPSASSFWSPHSPSLPSLLSITSSFSCPSSKNNDLPRHHTIFQNEEDGQQFLDEWEDLRT
jgi:hypothetical protein